MMSPGKNREGSFKRRTVTSSGVGERKLESSGDELLELEAEAKVISKSLRHFKNYFLIQSYDMFAIYRPEFPLRGRKFSSDYFKIYHSDSLLFKEDQKTRRRRKFFGCLLKVLVAYYLVKFGFIFALGEWLSESEFFARKSHLRVFVSLTSDPLSTMVAFRIFVYIGAPLALFTRWYLTVFKRTLDPYNYANIRFVYDPKREINRIDITIDRKLGDLLKALELRTSQMFSSNQRLIPAEVDFRVSQSSEWLKLASLRDQINQFRCNKHLLRPSTYTLEWFRFSRKYLTEHFVRGAAFDIVYILCIAILSLAGESSGRCARIAGGACNILKLFSLMEVVILVELHVMVFILIRVINFHFVLAKTELTYLFKLIEGARENLECCLSRINRIKSEHELESNFPAESIQRDVKLNNCMLKAFVQLMITHHDLKVATKNVTREMTAIFNDTVILVILWLITFSSKLQQNDYIRPAILLIHWVSNNALGLSCARMATEIVRLEKICFRIWNEKLVDCMNKCPSFRLEFVYSIWEKVIFSTVDMRNDLIIRPYSVGLTFERLVSINLFIFSFSSILFYR